MWSLHINVLVDVNAFLLVSDMFGTLDPFGSSSFSSNSSAGFADFSLMSKSRDPFEGRAGWMPDYQKVPQASTPFGADMSYEVPKCLISLAVSLTARL